MKNHSLFFAAPAQRSRLGRVRVYLLGYLCFCRAKNNAAQVLVPFAQTQYRPYCEEQICNPSTGI